MHASDTAELAFEDVRVPVENLLGEEGKGFYHISWELQSERMVACAGAVAGAQRMFERTLEYAKERKAFGRSIGNFQVIRHKFAEMATKIEAARQFTYATAWRYKNGEYPVREISECKLYTSRIACEVADECIQIHGGYGYMKEYEIERAYRDVRLNRIGAGTDEIMLEVIGRSATGSRARASPMSHVDHIRSYYESLNTGDADAVAAHFTEDAVHYYTRLGPHEGAETIGGYAAFAVEQIEGRWHLENAIEQGDQVAIEWTMTWRHPESGETRLDRGAEWFLIRDGKIAEVRAYHHGGKKNPQGDLLGFDHEGRGYTMLATGPETDDQLIR